MYEVHALGSLRLKFVKVSEELTVFLRSFRIFAHHVTLLEIYCTQILFVIFRERSFMHNNYDVESLVEEPFVQKATISNLFSKERKKHPKNAP